jgi:hypothetical protein
MHLSTRSLLSAPDLVDLQLYPLHQLDSAAGKQLLLFCRTQLAATGACNLPCFISESARDRLAEEARGFTGLAYRKDTVRNAYFTADDPSLALNHPRRAFWPLRMSQVANDLIPADALLRALYDWNPLLEFVRLALGMERLYRMADPYQALNLTYLQSGDQQPWHFDDCDFAITLLLQAAAMGGEFEFVPHIRSDLDENYDAVHRLLSGEENNLIRLPRPSGTLTLFRGRNSIHRVTEVRAGTRITAVLGFDAQPNCIAPDESNIITYGPRVAELLLRARQHAGN